MHPSQLKQFVHPLPSSLITTILSYFSRIQLLPREKQKLEYSQKLKDRYGHLPQIKRIER